MLYIALVTPLLLGGTTILLTYAVSEQLVKVLLLHSVPHYWRNLFRFSYSVLCTLGLAWLVVFSLFVFTDTESGRWVWGTWGWEHFPLVVQQWLWVWSVVMLPGIPGLLKLSKMFVTRPYGERPMIVASASTCAWRTSAHDLLRSWPLSSHVLFALLVLLTYILLLAPIAARAF